MSDAAYESLTAEDLGLPRGARIPLRFTPARHWSPLVISFPHVGLAWPPQLHPRPQVDFPRNADYDVHTLYEGCAHVGAASITAVFSRLVVDLNRAGDDISRLLVPDHPAPRPRDSPGVLPKPGQAPPPDHDGRPGRGVVWTRALGQVPLLNGPLSYADFSDRIDRFHAPYHQALEVLLARRRKRFGFAILLDAHSMPGSVGPDLVVGTLAGRACAPGLAATAVDVLRAHGSGSGASNGRPRRKRDDLWVAVNDPYLGGEVVRRFGRPREGLHALQIEVSRDLYMDERDYRLYAPATDATGTSAVPGRVPEDGAVGHGGGPAAHRTPIPAPPQHARRLTQLRQRLHALVEQLASYREPTDFDPSHSPTTTADHSA